MDLNDDQLPRFALKNLENFDGQILLKITSRNGLIQLNNKNEIIIL